MKKGIAALLVGAISMTIANPAFATAGGYGSEYTGYAPVTNTSYSDVPPTYWAYNAISRIGDRNWFSGYPDGKFRPDSPVSRAEAMKVFVVAMGLAVQPVTSTSYQDVSAQDWYAPYIEAGKGLIPVKTTFNGQTPYLPNSPITREDTVFALVTAMGASSRTTLADQSVLNMFVDKNSISTNIKPYVSIALTEGLVSGFDDDTIRAQDPLTRAEFATMLYR
ncbi:MAG: S-layer homology domain-containing protein, partial [Candidatus Ornithomonoglobus sp.]